MQKAPIEPRKSHRALLIAYLYAPGPGIRRRRISPPSRQKMIGFSASMPMRECRPSLETRSLRSTINQNPKPQDTKLPAAHSTWDDGLNIRVGGPIEKCDFMTGDVRVGAGILFMNRSR